jgi:membrane protease subunit (stomatin/prohibitin family)
MAIWDVVKKQFLDVLEWTEQDDQTLAWRFPIQDNEIQSGGQLTVRESQRALFVDQGRVADSFQPGRYELTTENLPILATLKAWPFGFNSPFKSEVYFFSTRQKLGQKWGTPQPVAVRDRELGSVQLRMFGTFAYHLADEKLFYREISGTREVFRTEDLAVQLVPVITSAAATAFGQSGVPFLDMAANQQALSAELQKRLADPFAKLGLALDAFVVESITLPPELQEALVQRQSMGIVGDMGRYAQYQAARSIPIAAANEGGIAGLGAGLAAGAAVGQMMGGALAGAVPGAGGAAAPAAAVAACVACGKPIAPGDPFCKHCGRAQERACPKCQAAAAPDAAFCPKCGTKLA